MREPIFGQNAKTWAIQFVIGLVLLFAIKWAIGDWLYHLSCTYLTGSCR